MAAAAYCTVVSLIRNVLRHTLVSPARRAACYTTTTAVVEAVCITEISLIVFAVRNTASPIIIIVDCIAMVSISFAHVCCATTSKIHHITC